MPEPKALILPADTDEISRAAGILREGGLVGMPTETVYGLAADARNPHAVARVFEAKGRPSFNPLIVHVASLEMAHEVAKLSDTARALAAAFWPGPLTLILPKNEGLADLVSAGQPNVALRIPAHPVARALIAAFGGPVAAPSANPSGRISPTRPEHVARGLRGRVDAVLDGGACEVGLESTILDPGPPPRLLREGGLPREEIANHLGLAPETLLTDLTPGRVEAPGQLERHYAPDLPLHIGGAARPEEISIGFGRGTADLTLSASGDLIEAAATLFEVLHRANAQAKDTGARAIRVDPVPDTGLGRAINDRLRRAAAPAP